MIEALKDGRYMTVDDLEAEFGWSVHFTKSEMSMRSNFRN